MIFLRLDNRSYDLTLRELAVRRDMSDKVIKRRVALRLNVDRERLEGHVVDRIPGGALVIRPAVLSPSI